MKYKFVYEKNINENSNNEMKLLEFLSLNLPFVTISNLKKQLSVKEIKVNGKKVEENSYLIKNDTVEIFLPLQMSAGHVEIETIFEDENILVVDKPILCDSDVQLKALIKDGREMYLEPMHRLDKNTRGLVIFSKNENASSELLLAFKNRNIEKTYFALCNGFFDVKKAIINLYLFKDSVNKKSLISDTLKPGYLPIQLSYEVVKEFNNTEKKYKYSKVKINLITGKMHQIRAVMSHLGHAVLGDGKYGFAETNKLYNLKYQQLTAFAVKFSSLKLGLKYLNGVEISLKDDHLLCAN